MNQPIKEFINYRLRCSASVPTDELEFHESFSRECQCAPEVVFDEKNGWHNLTHKSLEEIFKADLTDSAPELELLERVTSAIKAQGNYAVVIKTDFSIVAVMIAQLQLAFRHPQNSGPARELIEGFVRGLIEQLDPAHGDLYKFLMMGFKEKYDQF